MKRILAGLFASAAIATAAHADTFILNATSNYAGFYTEQGSFGATFDMTPDFVITNVNAGGGILATDNLFGTVGGVDQFTFDQATFNQGPSGASITFTSSTQPLDKAVMNLVSVTPTVIATVNNTSYVRVYTVTEGTVQDISYLWDYFSGDVKDAVTGAPIVTGVPEPSTWALMLIGLLFLGSTRWVKRRALA